MVSRVRIPLSPPMNNDLIVIIKYKKLKKIKKKVDFYFKVYYNIYIKIGNRIKTFN